MAAKESSAEEIMPAGKLKPLLALSKKEPVNAAVALTKDKSGVILVDKRAAPRAVAALLKKKAAGAGVELDAGTIRFGRAEVDVDADARLVTFTVNKPAAGTLRLKLMEHLKKAGFGRCEFVVDEALDAEADEGGPEAAAAPTAAPAHGDVTALLKRIPEGIAADPSRKEELVRLGQDAGAAAKAGDKARAQEAAEALRQALDRPEAAAGPSSAALQTAAKTRQAWIAARAKVEGELEKLLAGMSQAYQGHGFSSQLETVFHSKVEPMMSTLDHALSDKLDEVLKNTDAATHARLVQEAQGIIQKYEAYLDGEPLIKQFDQNPFVPVAIEKTLVATLAALGKAISGVAAH